MQVGLLLLATKAFLLLVVVGLFLAGHSLPATHLHV